MRRRRVSRFRRLFSRRRFVGRPRRRTRRIGYRMF